ncbi:MAG: class I SAM-dependent methyltransferase [Deltaproteobacteria bacterium]|nr:MAG: class I SAM-dependent methyltransferase [Deltaproteobacteria bacterium]
MPSLYRLLEHPVVYRVSEAVAAPGAAWMLDRVIARLLADIGGAAPLIDVGCGPASPLGRQGLDPIGLDLSARYVATLRAHGGRGVVAAAERLPFATGSIGGIWSVGLLHHLPDPVVQGVMRECARVAKRPGGYLAIIDGILPRSPWRRPVAHWIRRLDRGRFMRSEARLRALLHPGFRWSTQRVTYTLVGHEALVCVCCFEPVGAGGVGA